MSVFNKYSSYYDLLYSNKDYVGEANYIHQLISSVAPGAKSILDLGCGTGRHDFHLSQLNYEVDGVDLSASMIDIAQNNLQTLFNSQVENLSFSQGDIRTFRNSKKYDIVVSLFHVMSYQTTNSDLEAAFKTAALHLKEDGIFIFDFWYGPGVLTDPPVVRAKRLENEDIFVTRIAEPIMHPEQNTVDVKYTVFIKNKQSGEVEEIKETHKMRYLFLPEIHEYSKKLNLKKEKSYIWNTFQENNEFPWHGVVVLKKDKCI